jgi:hypothetical protein
MPKRRLRLAASVQESTPGDGTRSPAMTTRYWKVASGRDVESERGSDRESYAREFTIVPIDGGDKTQTTVEFAKGPGRSASTSAALDALRPFLAQEKRPPRRLLVQRDGGITELEV